jgi:hypothetical protein
MQLDVKDSDSLYCRYQLSIAGAVCELTTNSKMLGHLLCDSGDGPMEDSNPVFAIEILVEESGDGYADPPHFRGMHHVVVASFGIANVFVFDLLRRHLGARVSRSLAGDREFWQRKMLPIMAGVMGASIGVLPMHAACLASDGSGLLIAGRSGAGKSTLSAALVQNGFDYISDDWTYLSQERGRLSAYGMSAFVKLLPDAYKHFESLVNVPLGRSMNGELAYEVDARTVLGANIAKRCEPRWLVFLERFSEQGSEAAPLSALEARRYLESSVERLPPQLAEANTSRADIIDAVSKLPCWSFRYGGTPHYAARELRAFVELLRHEVIA